jgi:hypothetical protein
LSFCSRFVCCVVQIKCYCCGPRLLKEPEPLEWTDGRRVCGWMIELVEMTSFSGHAYICFFCVSCLLEVFVWCGPADCRKQFYRAKTLLERKHERLNASCFYGRWGPTAVCGIYIHWMEYMYL